MASKILCWDAILERVLNLSLYITFVCKKKVSLHNFLKEMIV
jgi:hypothetical protein